MDKSNLPLSTSHSTFFWWGEGHVCGHHESQNEDACFSFLARQMLWLPPKQFSPVGLKSARPVPWALQHSYPMKVLVIQSCLTLCDPMDHSPSGSSVRGILQARILEWVAIPFSRRSAQPRDWILVSCTVGNSLLSEPPGALQHSSLTKE